MTACYESLSGRIVLQKLKTENNRTRIIDQASRYGGTRSTYPPLFVPCHSSRCPALSVKHSSYSYKLGCRLSPVRANMNPFAPNFLYRSIFVQSPRRPPPIFVPLILSNTTAQHLKLAAVEIRLVSQSSYSAGDVKTSSSCQAYQPLHYQALTSKFS